MEHFFPVFVYFFPRLSESIPTRWIAAMLVFNGFNEMKCYKLKSTIYKHPTKNCNKNNNNNDKHSSSGSIDAFNLIDNFVFLVKLILSVFVCLSRFIPTEKKHQHVMRRHSTKPRNQVDFCANNPCPEGHQCMDHGNDFSCECPLGLSGLDCNQVPQTVCEALFLSLSF